MITTHPLADLLPAMSEQEYADLKGSIERNGLRRPIVMLGNKILAGRHRMKACEELGLVPQIRQYDPQADGHQPIEYVIDEELNRRHMGADQRAVCAAKLWNAIAAGEENSPEAGNSPTDTEPPVVPGIDDEKDTEAPEPGTIAAKLAEHKAKQDIEHSGQTANEEDGDGKKDKSTITPLEQELMDKLKIGRDKLRAARKLQQKDPELLEEVGMGKHTIEEALEIINRREGATQYRKDTADLLAADIGDDAAEAIRNCELLYPDRDLKAFVSLKDYKTRQEILETIEGTKWSARQAIQFHSAAFGLSDRLSDVVDWCDWELARTGKKRAYFTTAGHKVTIEEITK